MASYSAESIDSHLYAFSLRRLSMPGGILWVDVELVRLGLVRIKRERRRMKNTFLVIETRYHMDKRTVSTSLSASNDTKGLGLDDAGRALRRIQR